MRWDRTERGHSVGRTGSFGCGRHHLRAPRGLEHPAVDPVRASPRPSAATLERLAAALTASPTEATRAALLLSHLGTEQAHDLLLRRLEERVTGESREADAGDCTAARGLAGGSRAPRTIERLTALAAGPDPHPDLEVRTECAASLLCLGSEAATPWLLAVLRIDTAEAERRGEQLTTSETTAWPRGRAAEVALELEALLADR
ncbi:MAG: hypothetical protein ACYTFV_13205 [Planctomycetota bacterium]